MPHAPGTRLGPYEIVGAVGAGGMGDVYKARDTRLERTVAVKVAREAFGNRFRNEALAVAALNHPHIGTLFDVGSDYLVMEYVEGKALRGPLPAVDVVRLAGQIADALEHAHRHGVVHRDLKPSNILLTKSGVKVLDFGLAKRRSTPSETGEGHSTLTEDGAVLGTPRYMAPEQIDGRPADERSDIFAFGLVAVRDADRSTCFRKQERGERDGGDPGARAGADHDPHADDAAGARAGGADLPGQGPGRALAVGPGAEARPRVGGSAGIGRARRQPKRLDRRRRGRGGGRGRADLRRGASSRESGEAASDPLPDLSSGQGEVRRHRGHCRFTGRSQDRPPGRLRRGLSVVRPTPRFLRSHAGAGQRKRVPALLVAGRAADRICLTAGPWTQEGRPGRGARADAVQDPGLRGGSELQPRGSHLEPRRRDRLLCRREALSRAGPGRGARAAREAGRGREWSVLAAVPPGRPVTTCTCP